MNLEEVRILMLVQNPPAVWSFEFEDGRVVEVCHLIYGARVCLVSPGCRSSYDAEW